MSEVPQCEQALASAFVCVQSDLACNECFDPATFTTAFEASTRQSYFSTVAFTAPSDPTWCEKMNENVCQFYELNNSCCCEAETDTYRRCLVENALPLELQAPIPPETLACENVCTTKSASTGTGNGGNAAVIVIIIVVILAVCAGFYYYRRRRANVGKEKTSTRIPFLRNKKDSKKRKSNSKKRKSDNKVEKGLDLERGEVRLGPPSQSSSITDDDYSRSKQSSKKASRKSSSRKSRKGKDYEDPSYFSEQEENIPLREASDDYETSKKARAKKKRDMIEAWNKDRKQGSTTSLSDYLTDEGSIEIVPDERSRDKNRNFESSKRRSLSSHFVEDDDIDSRDAKTRESSRTSKKSRKSTTNGELQERAQRHRRSSSFDENEVTSLIMDLERENAELRRQLRQSQLSSENEELKRQLRQSQLSSENEELKRQLRQSMSTTEELQQTMPPVVEKQDRKKSSRSRSKSRSRDRRRSRSRSAGSLKDLDHKRSRSRSAGSLKDLDHKRSRSRSAGSLKDLSRTRSRSRSAGSLKDLDRRKSEADNSSKPNNEIYKQLSRSYKDMTDTYQSLGIYP